MTKSMKRTTSGLLLTFVVAATACDDFLDVNTNPNVPQVAPPDIRLPAVLATFSSGVMGSWPSTMGAEWTQQISFNSNTRGFARYDKYEMRDVDAGSLWDRTYGSMLSETKGIMEQTEPVEEWGNRLDDMNEEVIRRRLQTYYEETFKTLCFYPPELVFDVDASQSPLCVLRDIINRLTEVQKNRLGPSASEISEQVDPQSRPLKV